MKILGREPAMIVNTVVAVLALLAAFNIPGLTDETVGLIGAALTAVIAFVVNLLTRSEAITTVGVNMVKALFALAFAYGLELSAEQMGAVVAATMALFALFERQVVVAKVPPRVSLPPAA